MNNCLIKKIVNSQRGGTAILMTMMILGSVLFVVLATSDVIRNGMIASKSQVHSAKAYYAAESGAERILWEIRKNRLFTTEPLLSDSCTNPAYFCYDAATYGDIDDCDMACAPRSQELLSGEAVYTVTYSLGAEVVLTSTGTYVDPKNSGANLSRVIKIFY